jgi:hypothetical protein
VLKDFPDGPSSAVRVMDLDGANPRPLVDVPAGEFGSLVPFAYSDSGTRLLGSSPTFVSDVPSAIDPATGAVRRLVRGGRTDHSLTMGLTASGSAVLAILRGEDVANGRLVALDYATGRVLRTYARRASDASWAAEARSA